MASPSNQPLEVAPFKEPPNVITSTMNDLPGYQVERVLGTVYGLTVRTRNFGASLAMVGKSFAGGELKSFTTLLYNARNDAVERLVSECLGRGGNALIAMRFETSNIAEGWVQVAAYGTACIVRKIEGTSVKDARQGGVQA